MPPAIVWEPLNLLADLGIPAMLLIFGMSLHSNPLPRLTKLPRRILLAIVVKSFVVPGVALGLGLALGLSGVPLRAAVVLAALPTAQVVFVHALRYRTGMAMVKRRRCGRWSPRSPSSSRPEPSCAERIQ